MKNIFRLFLIWQLFSVPLIMYAQTTLVLSDTVSPYEVCPHMAVLEDTSQKLTIEQVSSPAFENKFYYTPSNKYNFGFSHSNYWLRFRVKAPQQTNRNSLSPWIVYIHNPLLGEARMYVPDRFSIYHEQKAGSSIPIEQRTVSYRYPTFQLHLHSGQEKIIYLYIDGRGPTDLPVFITSQTKFRNYDHKEQFLQGIFYGIMLVMTIYNFILFISLNERSYLFYVLYLIFGLLFHLSVSGYGSELLWSVPTWWSTHSLLISSYGSAISSILFCIAFLELRQLQVWYKICLGYIGLGLLMLFSSLWMSPLLGLIGVTFYISMFIVLALLVSVYSMRSRNPLAIYLLAAWSVTLISAIITVLTSLGLIASNTIALKSLQVGLICDVILLSLALARKINLFKSQKLVVEQEKQLAEQNQKIKEKVLATMSHEIRTPLNAVIGFAKMLQHSNLGQPQSDYVQHIYDSADNLLVLVNDILDMSKINAGKITFEQVEIELSHLTKLLLETLQFQIQTKKLDVICDIHLDVPKRFLGDIVRLNQILLNLMSNAVKFTHQGRVTLRIQLQQVEKQTITILFEVQDTGIGIPADKIASIFEGFTQATDETTRIYGGTGLGLSIVKQLVEMQGGQVQVRSTVGEGSIFSVILPFYRIFNATIHKGIQKNTPRHTVAHQLLDARILIIDDNPLNQVITKNTILHAAPHLQVEVVDGGKKGIEQARTHSFNVLLIDLQMPEMNGFEVAQYLRSHTEFSPTLLLIALTASTDENEHQKALAMGMDDVLTKPFEAVILFEKICKLRPALCYQSHT